jgi:hypothetical protein
VDLAGNKGALFRSVRKFSDNVNFEALGINAIRFINPGAQLLQYASLGCEHVAMWCIGSIRCQDLVSEKGPCPGTAPVFKVWIHISVFV